MNKKLTILISFLIIISACTRFLLIEGVFDFIFFLIILFCLIVFAYFFINEQISKRMISLIFKVEEMAAGNLADKIKIDKIEKNDEINQLVNSLNELISRLKTGVAVDVSTNIELNQAKNDFVAIASHQLRTPLSVIKWYVDFLLNEDDENLTAEQRKYLEEVYFNNERLIQLVNALLDVSRIDLGTFSIDPELSDIVVIIEDVIKTLEIQIKNKNINLKTSYDDALPLINIDSRLMKIVFGNILTNSIKYVNNNGRIEVNIKKTEKSIFIKIADDGCGIPHEQKPKIFTKLFRADNAKKMVASGTGLGLYIVKAIIEKSGGKIWFESPNMEIFLNEETKNLGKAIKDKTKGTTFFITIPLSGMKEKKGTKKLGN